MLCRRCARLRKRAARAEQRLHPAAVYIQAGAFLDIDNAHRLKARLASIGPSVIAPRGDGPRFYRVLVGPYADPAKARSVLSVVSDASRTNAKIVSD